MLDAVENVHDTNNSTANKNLPAAGAGIHVLGPVAMPCESKEINDHYDIDGFLDADVIHFEHWKQPWFCALLRTAQ